MVRATGFEGSLERAMTSESETDFLTRRAREEYERAENAPDPAAYRAHLELARQYVQRLKVATRARPGTRVS